MPQMAPIWWSTLFLTFINTYLILMMMMYSFNIYKTKMMIKNPNEFKTFSWKW